MRSIGAALKAHFGAGVTTIAACWKVTRGDAVVLGFTDHDREIEVGGVFYEPSSGFTRSALSGRADLSVDNAELAGFIDSAIITEADLLAGRYDNAAVEHFMVNWADTSQGILLLNKGTIGNITAQRGHFRAEIRGLAQKLQQTLGERCGRFCRADLGDARCGVNLASYTVTGNVTAVTSQRAFSDSARVEAADYFNYGVLTWTGGNNDGLAMEVKTFAGGAFVLFDGMPYTITVGDSYSVTAGCDKLLATCIAKFSNVVNFRGEPHIPGIDEALRYPDANA